MAEIPSPFTESGPVDAARAAERALQGAASFFRRHSEDAIVSREFGPFVDPPLAGLHQDRLRAMLLGAGDRAAALGRPLRVLDLGSGGGLLACALASLGHRALGIEARPGQLRAARLFAQEEKLDGMFIQHDLLKDVGWERAAEETLGGKPDLVTLSGSLHLLPEVSPLLKRLGGWLEPDSRLLVDELNPDSPLFKFSRALTRRNLTDRQWYRPYAEWKRLLEAHGFEITGPPRGINPLKPLAALMRVKPERSWSIVFTARRR